MGTPFRQEWCLDDIRYDRIEWEQNDSREWLYLLASASFVEITSDLYTDRLIDYFAADGEISEWLQEHWVHEEIQHGLAFKRYVNTVWPELDWDQAYRNFYTEYSRCCDSKQLGPTRALEMASRCVVETGTATLYTMLHRLAPDPVLRSLTAYIKNDEVRHYRHFYNYFLRFRKREQTESSAVLKALWSRISEIDREDGYVAFKHVFIEANRGQPFHDRDYQSFCRYFRRRANQYYPWQMAAKMLVKPLGIKPWMKHITVPVVVLGAKQLCR